MKCAGLSDGKWRLENAISYILIIGVVSSLLLELMGVVLFVHSSGHLAISQDQSVFIRGRNFFSFILDQFHANQVSSAVLCMVAGVVVLMLTPYVRVIMSALYFAREKNAKYVLITLFVLVVLTLSLVLH
jgi:uncharacterized membrane protein